MGTLRNSYRILRSILLAIVLTVITLYVGLYIVVSVPAVQMKIKSEVEKEVSKLLNSDFKIGRLIISPFNEVQLSDVVLFTPEGEECAKINKVGAGISLYRLWKDRRVVLTYAEIIGLNAKIWQSEDGQPLNIQFIIDALSPKDKNKPPTKFDIVLYNIVIRKSEASFDKRWKDYGEIGKIDFNHLKVTDLKADISLPRLSNDNFKIDVRRLSAKEKSGFEIDNLSLLAHVTSTSLNVENFILKLPFSEIKPTGLKLSYNGFGDILNSLKTSDYHISLKDNVVSLPDFKSFFPPLAAFVSPLTLNFDMNGNLENLNNIQLDLESADKSMSLLLKGAAENCLEKDALKLLIDQLKLQVSERFNFNLSTIIENSKITDILSKSGGIAVELSGNYNLGNGEGDIKIDGRTQNFGHLMAEISGFFVDKNHFGSKFLLSGEQIAVSTITDDDRFGDSNFILEGDIKRNDGNIDGDIDIDLQSATFNDHLFEDIRAHVFKHGKDIQIDFDSPDENLKVNLKAAMCLNGPMSTYEMDLSAAQIDFYSLGLTNKYPGYVFTGDVKGNGKGNSFNNLQCDIQLTSLGFIDSTTRKGINLNYVELKSETEASNRYLSFYSDWANGYINGEYDFDQLVPYVKSLLHEAVPAVFEPVSDKNRSNNNLYAEYFLKVNANNPLLTFLSSPFQIGEDIKINGRIDKNSGIAYLSVDAPVFIQNNKKIIRDTKIQADLKKSFPGSDVKVSTLWPVKNGNANLELALNSFNNIFNTCLSWDVKNEKGIHGSLSLNGHLDKDQLSSIPDVYLDITPGEFFINNAKWNIDQSKITYTGKEIRVDDLKIWHEGQYVLINGSASANPENFLKVSLRDIDLDYIFNTLNINYVTFGGIASGELSASSLFSKKPVAKTEWLHIEDLSYNGAVLGDAEISSHLDNETMEITIGADIRQNGERRALVDGGIWVTRDSLSFDFDANRVNVAFLKPFMAAFSSDIKGEASGKAKLFGTFKDIDMTGRIKADTLALKLDFTNVYYSGKDSVILNPGHIEIPGFRIFDKYGHSAVLRGELRHKCFHEPEFDFRLSEANNLLCYDTNASMNPDWYGTIYGDGSAILRGRPGYVGLTVDMSTTEGSNFTFVLNDNQVAQEYDFLTFSDKAKEALEREKNISHLLKAEKQYVGSVEGLSTIFAMDLRGTITSKAQMTLIMDPKAGDKITAHGNGAMQIGYDTETDELKMYGKYTLEEGNYNFSLQDLILKDFTIRSGSTISFNGDPLAAILNIIATYRVNTNLSDLDKSFANDKELNRTNVPVDAVLKVEGDMRDPNISLDIDLPTLTAEIGRKVRSIISTEDMMNRQIIYLLALNKFYTPEYMGGQGNGGELASVASSTLSSQLSNMISQLTNKFTLAPSFRSDKGDFSDMEVDVALSSRLLDNRLLINGNFGYRDRSTSQTTFIGDFDIEYLLNRNGNLRLKAYNHFNDQNYYLKSSLTTQGVGLIYRRDFDNPFTFLRRKRKDKLQPENTDSIAMPDTIEIVEKRTLSGE